MQCTTVHKLIVQYLVCKNINKNKRLPNCCCPIAQLVEYHYANENFLLCHLKRKFRKRFEKLTDYGNHSGILGFPEF